MSALIDRLSKLTGPRYTMDVAIALATDFWPKDRIQNIVYNDDGDPWVYFTDGPDLPLPPAYTASVDAAIALAERVFPGCDIETSDVHADFRGAKEPRHIADLSSDLVWEKYDGYPEPVYRIRGTGQSNIRAIALLIALLRAKEASKL